MTARPNANAQYLLAFLTHFLDDYYGIANFDSQPPRYAPRGIGAFGKTQTDTWTQAVMLDGERFTITVEKDPNQ